MGWIRRLFEHPITLLFGASFVVLGMIVESNLLLAVGVAILAVGLVSSRIGRRRE